ncbi:MAG: 5-oxoprolinase subunit PxpA [Undibacterium sp.]|nr:5-oxoprolinase subunit PxpA [Undibacterium sp.]
MPNRTERTEHSFRVDLNADLGEGGAFDAQILSFVSSANIACGGHTGDHDSMRLALQQAQEKQVVVGAHPSFVDSLHFGRVTQDFDAGDDAAFDTLYEQLCEQVQTLMQIAAPLHIKLAHLKPHGALYNQAAQHPQLGQVLIRVIQTCDPTLHLVCLAGSPLVAQARLAGLLVREEAFADRAYLADGSLVPRNQPRACLENDFDVLTQSLLIIEKNQIRAIDGTIFKLKADTLCLHGDGEHALHLVRTLHSAFTERGIAIQA